MIRYIFSIISILFITLSSWAQGGLPSRYNVSYLNMAAGMPNNFADDIFQDSYGFVWISTHGGGLVRYDGFNFMNFGLGGSWYQSAKQQLPQYLRRSFQASLGGFRRRSAGARPQNDAACCSTL